MKPTVLRLSPEEWRDTYAEFAHLVAFNERRPKESDRIDFALFAVRDQDPLGYVTCRELDNESLYWQYGGAFPGTRGTQMSWKCYQGFMDWCKMKGYKRIGTLIENKNTAMLKMAMQIGFRIYGVRLSGERVMLEHVKEF